MSFRYQFCDVKYYDLMYDHVSVVRRDIYTTWYIKKAFPIFYKKQLGGGVLGYFIEAGIFSMRASERGLSSIFLIVNYIYII